MKLEVINPFDQSTVAELPHDHGAPLERKVAAARQAFEEWRGVPLENRIDKVRSALRYFNVHADDIGREVTAQMGKPLAQSRREVATMLERAHYMIGIAGNTLAPEILPPAAGLHRRIEHAPLGVVFVISAWNYPLLIAVNVVVPALLAGNSVLLKHSALTPLTGRRFQDAFAGLSEKPLVTALVLTHRETARLAADRRLNYVAFTGSVRGGRQLYRALASQRLIDIGLELGGKDPAYVAADADVDSAVRSIVDGACYNAGQSCCAVERIYVHRSLYDRFLSGAAALTNAYRWGNPADETITLGPLASRANRDLLEKKILAAKRRGARVMAGGKRPDGDRGNFLCPTVMADVPQRARLMREESFGPVMPVAAVSSDEEAIARMNDSDFGLTASVWTRDRERAERFAAALEAGTVYQNRCDYLDPALPWTGVKDSGKGSTLSRYGFYALTRRKSVHFREVAS